MRVVLDSNCFYSDREANRRRFSELFKLAEDGACEIYVPSAVVDELEPQYEFRLEKALQNAEASASSGRKGLASFGLDFPEFTPVDAAPLVAGYRARLEGRLNGTNRSVHPGPTDLNPVIEWSIAGRRPFGKEPEAKKDNDVVDAVVWLTVLELAADDDVALVSSNSTDFGSSEGGLHPELVEDLQSLGLNAVSLFPDVSALLAELHSTTDVAQLAFTTSSHRTNIERLVVGEVDGQPVPTENLDVETELEGPPEVGYIELTGFTVTSAAVVDSDTTLLEFEAYCDATCDAFLERGEYYSNRFDAISVVDADWNERYVWAEIEVPIVASGTVYWDHQSDVLTSLEVREIQGLPGLRTFRHLFEDEIEPAIFDSVVGLAAGSQITVDPYAPPVAIESTELEAHLQSFTPDTAELLQVEHLDGGTLRLLARFKGTGSVEWIVSAPSPVDLHSYPSLSTAEEGDYGALQDVSDGDQVELTVAITDDFRIDQEIDPLARLSDTELETRSRLSTAAELEELERLQDLADELGDE